MNARNTKKVMTQTILLAMIFLFFLLGGQAFGSPKTITLSLSSWTGPGEPAVAAWNQMAKDLDEATKGRVKVKVYHSQTLGKAKEHYEIALKGIADMAYINVGFTPGRFPISDMVSFGQAPSAKVYTTGLLELMKKGYLDKEYEKVKLLYVWTGAGNSMLWGKGAKAATKLADFKGKKIRVPSTAAAGLMKALGASPVAIPMPEVYTSMERGVIDGSFTTFETLDLFRLSHVCNEITRMDSLTFVFCLVMNKSTWEKLPDEAKEVLDKNMQKYGLLAGCQHDKDDAAAIKKHKLTIYDIPSAEVKTIKQIVAPAFNKYLEKYEASGYRAKEAAQFFHQFLKKQFGVEPFLLSE